MGVSRSLPTDDWEHPLHGLRHPPAAGTSGWYCWTGELDDDPHFFVPVHQDHLVARVPEVGELLLAPPGSRFLLAPGYLDTWFDATLLDV